MGVHLKNLVNRSISPLAAGTSTNRAERIISAIGLSGRAEPTTASTAVASPTFSVGAAGRRTTPARPAAPDAPGCRAVRLARPNRAQPPRTPCDQNVRYPARHT